MAAPVGAISNFTPITAPTGAELLPAVYAGTAANYNITGNVFRTWLLASSALTGVPVAPTAAPGTNTTQLATTAFVAASFAPLASPALTGTPTAPTATQNTNTTQVASTAFVLGQATAATPLMNGTAAVGTTTLFARGDHVHPTDTTRAPLASPALTGTPTVPTAPQDTNTTQAASTAFVVAQAGSANPLVNGIAAVGTSLRYARQDHIHPTDASRAAAGANSDITSLTGITTPLSTAQGGTGNNGGAWTTFTPSVTFSGGSGTNISTAAGAYRVEGKRLMFRCNFYINYSTVPTSVTMALPGGYSSTGYAAMSGANTSTNISLMTYVAATTVYIFKYDGTFPTSGSAQFIVLAGTMDIN